MKIQALKFVVLGIVVGMGAVSCGPKVFTKGEYDDPNRVELLDDQFNEADMQQLADSVVGAVTQCESVKNAAAPGPLVIVQKIENRTEEHLDTVSLTNKFRTALARSKKVRFIDKAGRKELEEEYQYNEGGNVAQEHRKKRGKQVGADYVFGGELSTHIQEVGDRKLIFYKLTIQMTNLETSVIDCTEEKEIRKIFKKKRLGI